ncbi:MAG: hypothetical protein AB7V07_10050, partial [Candidatus Delongbacteria bacterium]
MRSLRPLILIALTMSLCAVEFYTPPKENKFTEKAEKFINSESKETRGFVIYFTDKNIFDRKSFEQAVNSVKLDEKTLRRRAKTFKRENGLIMFSDLPVNEAYIENLGLEKVRAVSKWFNFVSAEISAEKALEISKLEFVRHIDILPKKGKYPEIKQEAGTGGSKDAFYNLTYDQVNQINVPAVHALGHTGQGVRLLIIDTGF